MTTIQESRCNICRLHWKVTLPNGISVLMRASSFLIQWIGEIPEIREFFEWRRDLVCIYVLCSRWTLIVVLRMAFIGARTVNEWAVASGLNQRHSNTCWEDSEYVLEIKAARFLDTLDSSQERRSCMLMTSKCVFPHRKFFLNLDSHFLLYGQ